MSEGQAAIDRLLGNTPIESLTDFREANPIVPSAPGPIEDPVAYQAPRTFASTFGSGLDSGATNLAANYEAFKAAAGKMFGADEYAEEKLAEAQSLEQRASFYLSDLPTFEAFLEEPTLDGFLVQTAKAGGQVLPSAVNSISQAVAGAALAYLMPGAVAAVGGATLLSKTAANSILKREVRKTLDKKVKGARLNEAEDRLLKNIYDISRSQGRIKKGGLAGSFSAEFAPLTGSNLTEAIETGREFDRGIVLRSAGLAAPQAAIGTGSEYLLAKSIFDAAKISLAKSATKKGTLGNFLSAIAPRITTGAAIEGLTETAQEGLSVLNRFDLDPSYTAEEAKLRLAESAFAGTIGGGLATGVPSVAVEAIKTVKDAGVGKVAGSKIREAVQAAEQSAPGVIVREKAARTAANISVRTRELLGKARDQKLNQKINAESTKGDFDTFKVSPESEATLEAQFAAVQNSRSSKQAVFAPGDPRDGIEMDPQQSLFPVEYKIDKNGETFFAAYIPNVGTIYSPFKSIVDRVVQEQGTDESIGKALGYVNTSRPTGGGEIIVAALDRDGIPVSEEAAGPDTVAAAKARAMELSPVNKIDTYTVEEALAKRQIAYDEEQKIVSRNIDDLSLAGMLATDEGNQVSFDDDGNRVVTKPLDSDTAAQDQINLFDQGSRIIDAQETQRQIFGREDGYTARKDRGLLKNGTVPPDLKDARDAFDALHPNKRADWSSDFWGNIPKAALQKAIEQGPGLEDIDFVLTDRGTKYQVIYDLPEGQKLISLKTKAGFELLRPEQVAMRAVALAQRPADRNAVVITPDGKAVEVDLMTLVDAGMQLEAARGITGSQMDISRKATDSDLTNIRRGFDAILAELLLQDGKPYDLRIMPQLPAAQTKAGKQVDTFKPAEKLITVDKDGTRVVNPNSISLTNPGQTLPLTSEPRMARFSRVIDPTTGEVITVDAPGLNITDTHFNTVAFKRGSTHIRLVDLLSRGKESALTREFEKQQRKTNKQIATYNKMIDSKVDQANQSMDQSILIEQYTKEGANEKQIKRLSFLSPDEIGSELKQRNEERLLAKLNNDYMNPEDFGPGVRETSETITTTAVGSTGGETTRPSVNQGKARAEVNRLDGEISKLRDRAVQLKAQVAELRQQGRDAELQQLQQTQGIPLSNQIDELVSQRNALLGGRTDRADVNTDVLLATPEEQATRQEEQFRLPEGQEVDTDGNPIVSNVGVGEEHDASTEKASSAARPITSRSLKGTFFDRDNLPNFLVPVLNKAVKSLGLTGNIYTISAQDYANTNIPFLKNNAPENAAIKKAVEAEVENVLNPNTTAKAAYVGTSRTKDGQVHVIVLDKTSSNTKMFFDYGHELGHVYFNEALDRIKNPMTKSEKALSKRLEQSWIRERDAWDAKDDLGNPIPNPYADTKNGFEEWFADSYARQMYSDAQVALGSEKLGFTETLDPITGQVVRQPQKRTRVEPGQAVVGRTTGDKRFVPTDGTKRTQARTKTYATKESLRAKDGTTAFFRKLAQNIRKYYNSLAASYRARFKTPPDQNFTTFTEVFMKENRKRFSARPPLGQRSYGAKVFARGMLDTPTKKGDTLGKAIEEATVRIYDNLSFDGVKRIVKAVFLDGDNILRRLDKDIGPKIANMFYVQAQETGMGGRLGFLGSSSQRKDAYQNELERKLGRDWEKPEIKQAFIAAADQTIPTVAMDKDSNARFIREFLERFHTDYVNKAGHGVNIGFQNNFYPIVLDFNTIQADPKGFIDDLIKAKEKNNEKFSITGLENALDKILARPGEGVINDPDVLEGLGLSADEYATRVRQNEALKERALLRKGVPLTEDGDIDVNNPLFDPDKILETFPSYTREQAKKIAKERLEGAKARLELLEQEQDDLNPYAGAEALRQLTKGVLNPQVDLGRYVQDPQVAFITYLRRTVKRVEWNKATRAPDGTDLLNPLLNDLRKKDPDSFETAQKVINTYLGFLEKPLSPTIRSLNSALQFFQFVTLLPFAALSSVPDLAGPLINYQEFSGIQEAMKQIVRDVMDGNAKDKIIEAKRLAEDLGIVTNTSISTTLIAESEQDFMDTRTRQWSNVFFTATGLNHFTRYSRVFASGMGVRFLLRHAEEPSFNSARYLKDLGLTKEEVIAWDKGGRDMNSVEGIKVGQAVQRFVESSILKPNAAERPIWASDPRWALVWQLKSFFYAYSKTILGGVGRQAINYEKDIVARNPDASVSERLGGFVPTFALLALTTMPLAMLGLELREYAKTGLAYLIPGESPKYKNGNWKYFRSDRMDYGEYLGEIVDRSGLYGVGTLFVNASKQSKYGDSAALSFFGPTVGFAEDIAQATFGGKSWGSIVDRTIPIKASL